MNEQKKSVSRKVKKFYIVLGMLLLLLIPIAFMSGVIRDRESYRNEAVRNVKIAWADSQIIEPPALTLNIPDKKGTIQKSLELNNYEAEVKVKAETRKKGIFTVPVYTADVELKDGTIIDGIVLPHKPMRDDSSWYSFYDKNRLRHMSCDEYMFNTMIIMLTFEAAMMTRYYGLLGDEKHNITRVLEEVSSICVLIKGLEDAMKRHKLRSFTDITSDKVLDKVFKSIGWAK